MKKLGIGTTVIIFLVLLAIDLASTLWLGDLVKYLEANLIYQYVGILGIILVNFAIIAVVYWLYNKSSNVSNRFLYINLLVTICVSRILVIINNVQIALNPPTLQQAQQITQAMKTSAVVNLGAIVFIPYIVGILSFIIWKLDHKVEIKQSITERVVNTLKTPQEK